jgi:hypothetical protein
MEKLRQHAEREAHKLIVQAKERELLPKAIINAVYDDAEREVRRLGRRSHGPPLWRVIMPRAAVTRPSAPSPVCGSS